MRHRITDQRVEKFKLHLLYQEKSEATQEKYLRDVKAFLIWLHGSDVDKATVLAYKAYLMDRFAVASVNSILSALNSFFAYCEWFDCRVKTIKTQRQLFCKQQTELTKAEYQRLLQAAWGKANRRLYYLMQTICATGIRVSELEFITVEAVQKGMATVHCKGKMRIVILPRDLCRLLKGYIKDRKIENGSVFVTKSGKTLDRSNIWSEMKKLCSEAGVSGKKVFPHNLRHLFARTFYSLQKDIVRLADILGHSSVNTTRIYTVESGEVHRRQLQRLGLVQMRI